MHPEHLPAALEGLLGPGYTIGRELTGGGMSRVFIAHERALKRDVVVKVLPPDLLSDSAVARFRREIELTAGLQHPHILPVISAGGDSRLLYYIAPYLRGESLRDRIKAARLPSFADAMRLATELLNAVSFAHGRGVIHRDIKPGNVLLSEDHAILADFGIARAVVGDHEAHDGPSVSTLDSSQAYVAPENPRGEQRDLYAVAVVIHELLTGHSTAAGVSASAIARVVQAKHPEAEADAVRSVAIVIARAIAIDPEQRYTSAQQFREAVIDVGADGPRWRRALVPFAVAATLVIAVLLATREREPIAPVAVPSAITDSAPARVDSAPTPLIAEPVAAIAKTAANAPRGTTASSAGEVVDSAKARRDSTPTDYAVALSSAWLTAAPGVEQALAAATRALAGPRSLDAHDAAMSRGIIALGRAEYPEACREFERARVAREDSDAWMGLGECIRRDDTVVPLDNEQGVRFRTSYQDAARAYTESIRRAGGRASPLIYRRLREVVFTSPVLSRRGRSAEGRVYIGQMAMFGDTVEMVLSEPGVPRRVTPELTAALAKSAAAGRKRLLPIVAVWATTDPGSLEARETFANLLELNGDIVVSGMYGSSALQQVRAARAVAQLPHERLRTGVSEVRVLLRGRSYADAARLADSILLANPASDASNAESLLPLAMITGKLARATTLLELLSGTPGRQIRGLDGRLYAIPTAVIRERAGFIVRAALGVCDDEMRREPARLARVLDAVSPPPTSEMHAAFLERPIIAAMPCLGWETASAALRAPTQGFTRATRAFSSPGAPGIVAELGAADRAREAAGLLGANVDASVTDANNWLAVGDSAGALRIVTRVLDLVPGATPAFFHVETHAGGLVRAIVMAAQLSNAAGDSAAARRYGQAASALLKNADPALQPTAAAMRRIGGG